MKATILKRLLVVLIVLSFGFVLVLLNTHHNIDFDNDEAKTISYRPPATASTFLSQAGTEADPYVIANASDMITLANEVAKGNTFNGKVVIVASGVSEINLGDFTPIGTSGKPFQGTFDGYGVNFIVNTNRNSTDYVGIFGYLQTGGVLENFSVSGYIEGRNHVGAIVGYTNGGTVRNVYNTATVVGNTNVGGLIGNLYIGTLTTSFNLGEVRGVTNVGGLIGSTMRYASSQYQVNHSNNINNVYSAAKVSATGTVAGAIGFDNTARYSTASTNTRTNIWYDITVTVNFDQLNGYKKPSSHYGTDYAITSEQLFTTSSLLSNSFELNDISSNYGYYPELSYFKNHPNSRIVARSIDIVTTDISNGIGTALRPFLIRTNQDIETLKSKISRGNTFEGFHFKVADGRTVFNFGETTPIGTSSTPFYGSFNGNYANFNIEISGTTYQGLFGYFGIGTIENLYITGSVKGSQYVGGVVGYKLSGTIQNVYNLAEITGTTEVGGIVGRNQAGLVQTSFNHASIKASTSYAGGIAGYVYTGTVTDTYNRGEILSPSYAGGIVGGSMLYSSSQYQVSHTNSITNSYSAGLVSANTSPGGVIGYDNPARYSTSGANPRTNLYYDVSILLSYSAPYSKIPATTVGGQGLNKTSMFEDQMSTRGFSPSTWSFRPIDGNYAYYPQLQVFATSQNPSVVSNSLQSVITNPFLGDGTKLSPYIINTARDMVILSNSITDSFDAKDLYYLVAASVSNIDLTNVSYQPIGTSAHPFRGHFDGNHANFIVNLSGNDYLGLFGVTGQEAEIKNLSVTGEITGRNNLGAVAGYNQGLIENVYAKVNLNGMNNIGGLIGMNNGILKLFFSTGNITSTGSNIGGIVGYNSGEITEGYFGGKVQASSTVGALVGFSSNTNINEVYYNNTVIEFDDIIPGLIKPVHAVGNNFDFDHFKRSKEELTGTLVFNHVDLDSSNWILKATAGFYDFYPQLKGFASHANNAVKTNSEVSARIIRFAYGSGSKSNPYLIRDENDMKALSDITLNEHLSGIYFKVMDGVKVLDLTIPGLNFERIGHSNTRPFRGGFDGNDVEIIINSIKTTTDYLGLFGYLGEGAEVKNFTISGEISGRNRVGGLAAEAYKSTITNVRNHATVRGVQYVGGLVGYISNTTILQSYNTGDVISTSRDIGGLVGWGEKSTIIEAFNSGNVTASQVVGGIIGYANNNMTIQYVYNRGDITSTVTSGNSWVGGIIGAQYTNSTLSESYSAGAVIARTNSYIGGLLGGVSGTTYEEKSYYDRSVMDAQLLPSGYRVPASAIINKLETDNLKKLYKNELIGLNPLTTTELNPDVWEFVETKDLEAHYPQLKVFSQHYNDYVKEDSKVSVQTFVFVGEGTSGSPYVITSKDDMDSLSALVQRGITFEGAYFKVKDDIDTIDLTYGKPYVSIGTPEYPFEGYFDGYGTNFILNLSNELDSQGLFGVVGEHGVIRNLSVSGSIHARNQVGSIVGTNFGLVEHVYATTTIDGTTNVGGLIGQNFGTLRYGYHIGEVIGDSVVGGIVGKNEDTILETYAASYIFGRTMIGGVVGYSDGDETLSYYNSAKVDVKTHDTLFKPAKAVGNKEDLETLMGIPTNKLHSTKTLFTSTNWVYENKTGFYAFYPQLKNFATSAYKAIKDASKESVKVSIFNEGDGSEGNPYIIRNAYDMQAMYQMTQNGYSLLNLYFRVAEDVTEIDLTILEEVYIPVGNQNTTFQGNFDGNGVVFNLNVNRNSNYQGLFGVIGSYGVVKNVGVKGSYVGSRFTGGIAGRNYGLIENAYNLANIQGYDYVGGITGYNDGLIYNTYNHGEIIGNDRYVGGIAGGVARNKEIKYAYNTANIYALNASKDWTEAGGIVGYSAGIIEQTYSIGGVFGKSYLGGIVGRSESFATIDASYYLIEAGLYEESKYATQAPSKATKAIGNLNVEGAKDIYKNQLTGELIFGVNLNLESFVLKQSIDFISYLPQLRVFAEHEKLNVRNDSSDSVVTPLLYGDGTEEKPYKIHSSYDLRALGIVVAQGFETLDTYYLVDQQATFDFTHLESFYVPIGTHANPFKGNFNGNKKTIHLKINRATDYVGLFGVTGEEGFIQNVTLAGTVTGLSYVGSLAGYNQAKLEFIISDTKVTGEHFIGGLTGYTENELTDISVKGNVTGKTYVGGLIGSTSHAILSYTYAISNVVGESYVAGLIGMAIETEISESFASGSVKGNTYVSGFVASLDGMITLSYATNNVTGNSYVAGLVATNLGHINDVYHSGLIDGNTFVAGITSINSGVIDKAYYNETLALKHNQKQGPQSAIYHVEDTLTVGHRTLDEMTANFPFGLDESQMDLDAAYYYLRNNFDFTQYLPELISFTNHSELVFREDSLLAITYLGLLGKGTKDSPYLIYDGKDMIEIDERVKVGNTFTNKYFKVADGVSVIDLTVSGLNYQPIGSEDTFFNGFFNGNNAIFKIGLDEPSTNNQGIFNTLGVQALVENLIVNGSVRGLSYVGSIAGRSLGTIKNVTNYAQIIGEHNDIGGIVGYNEGTMSNVINFGKVTTEGSFVGGIAGQNYHSISDAYNKEMVTGFGNVGGISGVNHGYITNTYNMSNITATKNIAGGIAGSSFGDITYSFNHGNIKALDSVAGGIAGVLQDASIDGTYNSGEVTALLSQAGGLVANLEGGIIKNSYHIGYVFSKDDLGIIVGHHMESNESAFQNVYYDLDLHLQSYHSTLNKPTRVVGNRLEISTIKGLYHGQMIGTYAVGNQSYQMNLTPSTQFKVQASKETESYYPQMTYFANHANDMVKQDSLKSVTTQTFIVGDGSVNNPYIIRNESDWLALADSTTSGNDYKNKFFEIAAGVSTLNFDAQTSIYAFKPVGTNGKPFNGILDGNGVNFVISSNKNESYQALFGHLGKDGVLRHVSVSGSITGADYTAAIAALNEGLIEEVYNDAAITGKDYVAGIVARNLGTIKNVYNHGKIKGENNVAGIVAELQGNLQNSYNAAVIYGKTVVGALVGNYIEGMLTHSYYDLTIIESYRDLNNQFKPSTAVGTSFNGDNVKGLDHRFMVGSDALGTGALNMNFLNGDNIWTSRLNINEDTNYPQLQFFAIHEDIEIRTRSKESTLTTLFIITFDERNEESNTKYKYVLLNEHFSLYIPEYFGYNFLGWFYQEQDQEIRLTDKNGLSTTPFTVGNNLEVYAKWEEAYHKIQFVDGQNKVVYETEVRHGQYVEEPIGVVPTKNKDQLYVYRFSGWNFDFANTMILGPIKITANYEAINRYYEVIYYDGDGNVFEIEKGEYETYITPTSKIPTKTYHDDVAYKFIGWNFNFNEPITKNVDIHPQFAVVDRYYEVNFYMGNIKIHSEIVEYLASAIGPQNSPTKPSSEMYDYTFNGWDQPITNITQNLDVYATFKETLRTFRVIFMDGDKHIFNSQTVSYGEGAATPNGTPTKTYEYDIAYKFTGWDKDYSHITSDLVVTATFEAVPRYYRVTFYNEKNQAINSQIIEYLKDAIAPAFDNEKEPTEQYIYTLIGWSEDYRNVTKDLDIYPVYEESLRPYNVYFMDGNNKVFDTQVVLYGMDANIPAGKPTKQGIENTGFKFVGWDSNYKNITSDTYVKSNYTEVYRWYYVTFMLDDLILKTERVEYGFSANAPEITFNPHPTQGYEYYFINFDQDFSFVESDLTVKVIYGSRLLRFTVTIKNGDETTTQIVEWGKNAILPTPSKKGNDQVSYVFVNWDHDGRNIRQDLTITAIFEPNYHYYEVRFYDGDLNLIKLEKVFPGESASAPTDVQKTKTDEYVYVFTHWDKDFTDVQSDLNVYAKFVQKDRYYQVTFYNAFGQVIANERVEYGMSAHPPLPPQKVVEGMYLYNFIGWSEDFEIVVDNLEIHPLYEEVIKTYTVNFYDGDGNLIHTTIVNYGLNAIAPATATKSPTETRYYIFNGWTPNYQNVTTDQEVYAQFTEVDRYYEVKFIGKNNEILFIDIVEYGKDARNPIPLLGKDVITYINDDEVEVIIGWDQSLASITSNKEIHAIYGIVARYYDVSFYDELGNLIVTNRFEYGDSVTPPDAPSKPANETYFYVFERWSEDTSFITSNLDVYPIYQEIKTTYQVIFYDGDGNIFSTQTVAYGKDAVNPGIPPKMPTDYESFVFTGWDQAFTNITEDLEIYPEFRSELRSFIVIFKDDQGNILKEEFVVRGYSASAPTNIKEKPKNEYYEYIPKWDQDFTNVQSDLVITLYYEEIERLYYLRFFDDNNQLMLTITGTYNQYVDAPAAKEKPMTEQFIYHFVSWSPVFENYIKEDQDYYPIYDRTIRQYLVTFIDGDGNVFDEQYVAYGQQPQVPSGIPGKTSTQQYYYEFKMWETTTVKVYQDLEIHAVFNRYLQVYRVTFVDEFDNVLSYQLIPYGQGATEPDSSLIPDKPSTREYVYVFAGWDQSFSFITEDIVVKTVYIGTLRKYTYTFYDEDEVTILKQIVGAYGDPIIPPEAPTKPSTESSIFKFIGWHIPVQDILTEDVIYIARYQEVLRTYRVIFMDGNGFVFDAQVVNYGEAAKTPAGIPSKSPTTMYQFEFIGWIEDYSNVTSDLVINANFLRKLREFKVTFIADKDVYVFYVPYGGSAEGLVATPSKVGYRFIDWDQTLTFITKDTEVKAIFKPNSYYIEFDSGYEEGDVIPVTGSMTRLVKDFDSQVTLPSVGFEREGYVFIGWRKEGDDFISYFNEETFKLTDEGLKLYATWLAISYDIYYDLDGGEAINPTSYTVEDYIILQNAYKKDYRFIGWYLVDEQGEMLKKFKAASEIKVDEIYPGEFIGDITLVARYDYEGFIQLKDEYKDVLGLYYADITTRIPIEEREKYNDENPVYLIGWGVYLNMTIGELKSRFVNENLIVTDEDGNELTDDEIVATSQQIIVKNTEGIIIDRVHIVLYGDANGDGKINAIDSVEALNFISGKSDTVSGAKILSVDLNEDGKLNAIDTTQLLNHISGKWSLY